MLDRARHLEVLRQSGNRLADAASTGGPGDPVPACPGWALRDLLLHIGGVHRWATSYVLTGRTGPTTEEEDRSYFERVPDDRLVGWYREGLASLVDALVTADESLDCWTFLPTSSPLAFWTRRQAHETAIHSADADAAVGRASAFPADFAADGVDELLYGFLSRPGRTRPVSVAIRPTDRTECWTVRDAEDGRLVVVPEIAGAACQVSGPASDLYLLLWNRGDLGALEVTGDLSTFECWRAGATVRWS